MTETVRVGRHCANLIQPMRITVNGIQSDLEVPITVAEFIRQRRTNDAPCAVELNERLVAFDQRETVLIQDGDRVEVVTLVGGG